MSLAKGCHSTRFMAAKASSPGLRTASRSTERKDTLALHQSAMRPQGPILLVQPSMQELRLKAFLNRFMHHLNLRHSASQTTTFLILLQMHN